MKTQATFLMLFFFNTLLHPSQGQSVLFDFDNAPQYTSLPITLTDSGITAHFSATGSGYSIQDAGTLGFTPWGFGGRCIYPNSVFFADLLISFDQPVTKFSIMYSPQELGCDDAETMRVTAYLNGGYVGTSTKVAGNPGTWPTDSLVYSSTQGFDSVVIHYDSSPPTCQDYGVIFLADNMRVTAEEATGISSAKNSSVAASIVPNPVSEYATISFSLFQGEKISVGIYDLTGKLVKNLFTGYLSPGEYQIYWNANSTINDGIYFLKFEGESILQSYKIVVAK